MATLTTYANKHVFSCRSLLFAMLAPFLICSLLTVGFYVSALHGGKSSTEISPRTINKHQIRMVMEMMRQGETLDDALEATMGVRTTGL
jgi:hypothetical protein